MTRRPFIPLLCFAFTTGCDGCNEDKPYTPFTVTSAALPTPTRSARDAASRLEAGKNAFEARPAIRAVEKTASWELGGIRRRAPDGWEFSAGLTADFDHDGEEDAVAWLEPTDANPDGSAQLHFYKGKARDGVRVSSVPGFVPRAPGCELFTSLSQTGPSTVTVRTTARCATGLIARTPTESLTVLAPAAKQPEVLGLRLADAAPDERLELLVDSQDRDGDGRDDVAITFTMQAQGSKKEASAPLLFLDRATGPARDASEPGHTLAAIGSVEVVRAKGKNTGRHVADRIGNARRLISSLCAEGGVPRVFDAHGSPIRCGNLSLAIDRFVTAEVRAQLTLGDPRAAFAMLGMADWYFEAPTSKTKESLDKEVGARIRLRSMKLEDTAIRARAPGSRPRYSPLAFDESGRLLVQTVDGILQTDRHASEPVDVSEEVDPWPLSVFGGDFVFGGLALSCDRSEIVWLLNHPDGSPAPSVPTRILAPRPGVCAGAHTAPELSVRVVEFTGAHRAALLNGLIVGTESDSADIPMGSPRSSDGRWLISEAPGGLLVSGDGDTQLWAHRGARLSECVIASGGRAAACLSGTRVVIAVPTD